MATATAGAGWIRAALSQEAYARTRRRSPVLRVRVAAATPLRVDPTQPWMAPEARGCRLARSSVHPAVDPLGDGAHRFELTGGVGRGPLGWADLGAGVRSRHLELFGADGRRGRQEA